MIPSMKIVFQHDGVLPVKTYGGTERIMFWHMKELVRKGHKVVLIGHPDSIEVLRHGIELLPIPKEDLNSPRWQKLIPRDTDIVHLQYNYMPDELPSGRIGVVNTIHGNGKVGETFQYNSVFVSKTHADLHGAKAFVPNALDFSEYPFERSGDDHKENWDNFLFLAKGSWKVKNLKHCIKAAKKTEKTLHIAGGRAWWPSKFIKNYGMIGGEEKMRLLKECDALVFPVRWPEPFGIAVIEAMSQGKPVIASPYGAMSEIITPETGIICKNYEEFEAALRNPPPKPFSREVIRQYVEDKYNIARYTQRYVEFYDRVKSGVQINPGLPSYQGEKSAEELLPF